MIGLLWVALIAESILLLGLAWLVHQLADEVLEHWQYHLNRHYSDEQRGA